MRDLWHFPRPDDAARIIGTLQVGLVSALAIIEPRRRGKTTFLLEDLMPAAAAGGMLPIYINLAATSGELEPFLAATIKSATRPSERNDGLAQGAGQIAREEDLGQGEPHFG